MGVVGISKPKIVGIGRTKVVKKRKVVGGRKVVDISGRKAITAQEKVIGSSNTKYRLQNRNMLSLLVVKRDDIVSVSDLFLVGSYLKRHKKCQGSSLASKLQITQLVSWVQALV